MPATVTRPLDVEAGDIADGPIEADGHHERSDVRLLVAGSAGLQHRQFGELPDVLAPGDLLVINASGTMPAAVSVDGDPQRLLHLSGREPGGRWLVELRRPCAAGSTMDDSGRAGQRLTLSRGAQVHLVAPFEGPAGTSARLWVADLDLPAGFASPEDVEISAVVDPAVVRWLYAAGRPIRYGCTASAWPLEAYQTAFAQQPGSAEMPSASRPFTDRLIARLAAHGVDFAPLVLHTGVSSLERGEAPYPEWFTVPAATADAVNRARAAGRRVIAVGTTVVRALESALAPSAALGSIQAASGWTDLLITAERGVTTVDGLITGWHEPEATHLDMLQAVAGRRLVEDSYATAVTSGYRWHEFGDSHLLLP